MTKKVAVALSGGVDSAVAALLLKQQGYEVVGITGKMLCDKSSEEVVINAKNVAKKLDIQHYTVDVSDIFKDKVINYFENSYIKGKTPNPCIMCNKHIKWGCLFDYAINTLNCDYIATGHYAKIVYKDCIYKLYPASDEHKDQLYFLFMLSQEQLSKTLFPLSDYKKDEIKELALKYDLPPKSAKESQDICFIKHPMNTKKYLNNVLAPTTGNFIDKSSGKILGQHDGYWQYTIGQRKGIGIAAPEPLYVLEIKSETNEVFVGYRELLSSNSLTLNDIKWAYPISSELEDVLVKIRYNMPPVKAKIINKEHFTSINFLEPVSGIAPGQACVLYDINDGHLLGGSFIC